MICNHFTLALIQIISCSYYSAGYAVSTVFSAANRPSSVDFSAFPTAHVLYNVFDLNRTRAFRASGLSRTEEQERKNSVLRMNMFQPVLLHDPTALLIGDFDALYTHTYDIKISGRQYKSSVLDIRNYRLICNGQLGVDFCGKFSIFAV